MMEKGKNISEDLRFDPEKGELSFNDIRYMLIRPETIVQFQKEVEKAMGERTSFAMSSGGYEGGSLSTSAYKEKFSLSDEEVVDFMCSMGSQLGWGRFQLVELTEDSLVVDVHNSAFAEKYGPSENAICHMIEGVLAGLGKTVLKSDVRSIEEMCVAKGDEVCRFVIKRMK
ncbi:MAG: 4-vinyl reductase [Methanobacteriota archaeon]|nr:MAG: 4-vinyl reductase [Euryarchaeota archaeon]